MEKTESFSVCFSGHRPEKLVDETKLHMLQSMMYLEIQTAVEDGATVFYSGLARGVDLWAANCILKMQEENPSLQLIGVCPFPQYPASLHGTDRQLMDNVMEHAADIIVTSNHYHPSCYRIRNAYMVQHTQRLIALCEDLHSGTAQTIRLAKRYGLDIRCISMQLDLSMF